MKLMGKKKKKSKSWGSVASGLVAATTAFPSSSTLFSTSIYKNLHFFFVILILGYLQNRESKEKQNAGALRKHNHSVTTLKKKSLQQIARKQF